MKVGSLVECIHKYGWYDDKTKTRCEGPVYKEICEVAAVNTFKGEIYLELIEHKDPSGEGYLASVFREVQPPMDLSELMEETATIPQLIAEIYSFINSSK